MSKEHVAQAAEGEQRRLGSVLRDHFAPNSDIDVLVEFELGRTPGLAFFTLQDELSALFGRRVDLNTLQCLSLYFRDEVEAEAEELYVGRLATREPRVTICAGDA